MKLAFQFILKNKKKSMALLFSMVLSVALMVGISAYIYSANLSKSNYYADIKGNFQYSYLLNQEQLNKSRKILKSSKIKIQQSGLAGVISLVKEPKVISIISCNIAYLNMNHMRLLKGSMPKKNGDIILENWMISNLGLKTGVGEVVKLGDSTYKVVGIVSDSFEKKLGNMNVYNVSEQFYPGVKYKLYVNFNLAKNIDVQSKILMHDLGCQEKNRFANWDVIEPLGVHPPNGNYLNLTEMSKYVLQNKRTVTILLSLFSAYIIYSILNIFSMQRMPIFGILRALGADKRQLFLVLFLEILFLFFIGYPIGCFVGAASAKFIYIHYSIGILNSKVIPAEFKVDQSVILEGFIILLLFLIIMILQIVRSVNKRTSIETMNNLEQRYLRDYRILAAEEGKLLYHISHRYMNLKRGVLCGILISIALGGIVFCSSNYITSELMQENELTLKADDGLNSDYLISMQTSAFDQGIPEKMIDKLMQIKGINEVSPVKYFFGATYLPQSKLTQKHFYDADNNVPRIKKYFGGICTKISNNYYLLKGNIYGYNNDMLSGLGKYILDGKIDAQKMEAFNEVIVCLPQDGGTLKFDTINLKPGDTIEVIVPRNLNAKDEVLKFKGAAELYTTKKFKIAATVKRVMAQNNYFIGPGGMDIIMTNTMMKNEFDISDYNMVSISRTESVTGIDTGTAISKLASKIPHSVFQDYTYLIDKENLNLKQRQTLFTGLSFIILLISMLHVMNSMNYLVISRKRDFGILRAMGLSDIKLRIMILREGLLYGIYSSIVMVSGIAIATGVIYFYLKKIMLLYEPVYLLNWTSILICIVINISLCLLASIISSKAMIQETILDSIRLGA